MQPHQKWILKRHSSGERERAFPPTFASPTGKRRRPASLMFGDSEVPAGPLLVLWSGRWRGDSGDRLRSTVQLPRAVTGCWWGQVLWAQGSDNQVGMAAEGVMEANMLSPPKQSPWPGLRDNFSEDGETQPSPSAWHWQLSCCCFRNVRAVYQHRASMAKLWRGARWTQQAFLSSLFLLLTSPLCLASMKPKLSPINGDSQVLSAWTTAPCTKWAHRGAKGKPTCITCTRLIFITRCKAEVENPLWHSCSCSNTSSPARALLAEVMKLAQSCHSWDKSRWIIVPTLQSGNGRTPKQVPMDGMMRRVILLSSKVLCLLWEAAGSTPPEKHIFPCSSTDRSPVIHSCLQNVHCWAICPYFKQNIVL